MTKCSRSPTRWLLRAAMLLLAGCGGDAGSVVPAAAAGAVGVSVAPVLAWQRVGTLPGLCCNYTPLVVLGDRLHIFSNVPDGNGSPGDGQMYRYLARWGAVEPPSLVLPSKQITDVPGAGYKVRTMGVRHDANAGWVAVLRVGQGYPTLDGYVPALATSPDGQRWTYRGKLVIEGRVWPGFSDSNALVLQMNQPAVVNAELPFQNRYLIFETNLNPDGKVRKLIAVYSADGVDWRFYRDAAGQVVDLWPADAALAGDQPVFPTAESTNGDIHVLVGDRWRESAAPVWAHRHLCAPKGSSQLRYLGDAQTWRSGDKVPNLAYDAATDTLVAISQAVGYALPGASKVCR